MFLQEKCFKKITYCNVKKKCTLFFKKQVIFLTLEILLKQKLSIHKFDNVLYFLVQKKKQCTLFSLTLQ